MAKKKVARALALQQQQVEESAITRQHSFQVTKNLLRISIFQIAYIRSLFPAESFVEKVVFDDQMKVHVLNPKDEKAERLIEWMERGACEAMYKEYLKCLRFGVTSDEEGKHLVEEYVFTFAYEDDGEIRMQILNPLKRAPVNALTIERQPTMKQIKAQVGKMTRLLVALMTSFDPLPEEKFIFMHLEYHSRAPADYEPPYFEAVGKLPNFAQKPFSMSLGACQTKEICVGLKAKSQAVSEFPEGMGSQPMSQTPVMQASPTPALPPPAWGDTSAQPSHNELSSCTGSLVTAFDQGVFNQTPEEALGNVASLVGEHGQARDWAEQVANGRGAPPELAAHETYAGAEDPSRHATDELGGLTLEPAPGAARGVGEYKARAGPFPVEVGSRIGVWWAEDKAFYYGKVVEFNPESGEHRIRYEDGEVEWLNLAKEKLVLRDSNFEAGSSGGKSRAARGKQPAATGAGRKAADNTAGRKKGARNLPPLPSGEMWDCIPASQPIHDGDNPNKKKLSRGILTELGPSKRIRMQEV